ncbi:hypothetical protein SAMN05660485_03370 [Blastococcus fimeti]|nr:hypothetical protein SAMN05660485_03370 [Blastococcus fimeti]
MVAAHGTGCALHRWLARRGVWTVRSLFGGNGAAAWDGLRVGRHDDRVTARGWALPLALLVLATSACGGDDHERLLTGDDHEGLRAGWERGDQGVPPSVIRIYEGETHCDMDSALLLEIYWPPDGGSTENAGHTFVRDPDGVFAEDTDGSFDPDAELPGDAIPTGWEHGSGVELWLADDLSTAYAVDGDSVEAWPALTSGWICA